MPGAAFVHVLTTSLLAVRFLRAEPHAYYYCKAEGGSCKCKSLDWSFGYGVSLQSKKGCWRMLSSQTLPHRSHSSQT